MPAPAFGAAGSFLSGASGSSAAIPVPSGVTDGQIVLAHLYREIAATVTPPAGFFEVPNSPALVTTGGQEQWLSLWWKRATGNDSGTYSFTWSGSTWRAGYATRYTGCIATGSPIDDSNGAGRSTAGTATPAVAVTTNGPDRLLVWTGGAYNDGAWTPPTDFTERADNSGNLSVATRELAAAGPSGSVSGTGPNSAQTAFLLALLPEAIPFEAALQRPVDRFRPLLVR